MLHESTGMGRPGWVSSIRSNHQICDKYELREIVGTSRVSPGPQTRVRASCDNAARNKRRPLGVDDLGSFPSRLPGGSLGLDALYRRLLCLLPLDGSNNHSPSLAPFLLISAGAVYVITKAAFLRSIKKRDPAKTL